MKSCIWAFMLLPCTESVAVEFSAGCEQDAQAVPTAYPVPQGIAITGRVLDEDGNPVAAGPGGVDPYTIPVHARVTSTETQGSQSARGTCAILRSSSGLSPFTPPGPNCLRPPAIFHSFIEEARCLLLESACIC